LLAMRNLTQSLTLTSMAMAVRGAFNIASINPSLWWDAESHRAALAGTAGATATAYQDAAGTSAVTAVEQPVGLVLDQSRGYQLGPNRVTNGDFSEGSVGWVGFSSWSIAGSRAVNDGTNSSFAQFRTYTQPPVVEAGKTYELTFSLSHTNGSVNVWFYNNHLVGTFSASGTYKIRMISNLTGFLLFEASPGAVLEIDDVSCREIYGIHALQSTSTARPLLSGRKNLLTYSDRPGFSAWLKNFGAGVTVLDGQATGPDGQQNMGLVTSGGAGGALYQNLTPALSAVHSYSAYIRQSSAQSSRLSIFHTGIGVYVSVTWAWSAGVPSVLQVTGSPSNVVIADAGGGLYRISFAFTTRSSGGHWPLYEPDASGGTGTALVGYLQLELGPTATSYQRINAANDYALTDPLYMQFDGVDDAIGAAFAAGTMPANADVYVVVRRAANEVNTLMLYGQDQARYIGAHDGGSNPVYNSVAGSPSTSINGALVSGPITMPSAPYIYEARGANLSTWTAVNFGGYGASWTTGGSLYAVLICPAQSNATRTKIRKALAKRYQIQGVV
jgi:hypothetical protein